MSLNNWLLASNAVFFVLSGLALTASIAIFLLTRANDRAKDRELRRQQFEAAQTVAVANATAETAKADAARANERAAASELKLEQIRTRNNPRTVNEAVFLERLANVPKRKVLVSWDEQLPESIILSLQISGLLTKAGWDFTLLGQTTPEVARCARLGNLLVLSNHLANEEATGFMKPPQERPNTPFFGLTDAFVQAMHDGEAGMASCLDVPEDVLQVVIGPRLVIIPKQ